MSEYRIATVLTEDRTLTINDLPFRAGEAVEVIVMSRQPEAEKARYPLHGTPIRYKRPTDPVAEEDWEALR